MSQCVPAFFGIFPSLVPLVSFPSASSPSILLPSCPFHCSSLASMDKSNLVRKDSGVELDDVYKRTQFFDLPPEIRTSIYKLVFSPSHSQAEAFHQSPTTNTVALNEDYYASDHISALLTCRQLHADASLLAFSRTTFVVRNPFTAKDIRRRLQSRLQARQIASLRSIAFVAEADHFRQMRNWKGAVFGVPELQLDSLNIVLYRSSYWHYLFDFNMTFISLLRDLRGVKRMTFVRNESRVKPHFHTWFNRLVAAMLKIDRFERFGRAEGESKPENVWWKWDFDAGAQLASLTAVEAKKADLRLDEYDEMMQPTVDELIRSINAEEYDPDPMSRNGF